MAIPDSTKRNFKTLLKAVQNGDVCLMQANRTRNLEEVYLLCAVTFDGTEYEFIPFAEMASNPYQDYVPPVEVTQ